MFCPIITSHHTILSHCFTLYMFCPLMFYLYMLCPITLPLQTFSLITFHLYTLIFVPLLLLPLRFCIVLLGYSYILYHFPFSMYMFSPIPFLLMFCPITFHLHMILHPCTFCLIILALHKVFSLCFTHCVPSFTYTCIALSHFTYTCFVQSLRSSPIQFLN